MCDDVKLQSGGRHVTHRQAFMVKRRQLPETGFF